MGYRFKIFPTNSSDVQATVSEEKPRSLPMHFTHGAFPLSTKFNVNKA